MFWFIENLSTEKNITIYPSTLRKGYNPALKEYYKKLIDPPSRLPTESESKTELSVCLSELCMCVCVLPKLLLLRGREIWRRKETVRNDENCEINSMNLTKTMQLFGHNLSIVL